MKHRIIFALSILIFCAPIPCRADQQQQPYQHYAQVLAEQVHQLSHSKNWYFPTNALQTLEQAVKKDHHEKHDVVNMALQELLKKSYPTNKKDAQCIRILMNVDRMVLPLNSPIRHYLRLNHEFRNSTVRF